MRYFSVLTIILLLSACKKHSESNTSVTTKLPPTAKNGYHWFPELEEEERLIIEVEKIKDRLTQLIIIDSVEQTLEEIYYRDQIYRDSIQTLSNLKKADITRLYQKINHFDKMNSELAIKLLKKWKWPKTRNMSNEAQEALCLVTVHNNIKELNQLVSENFNRAYDIDSSFSPYMFAVISDRFSLRAGGQYIYGTLDFKPENYSESEITQINTNRSKLGLKNILNKSSRR